MDRRIPFTLDRHEKKILGVCSGLGRTFNIDPTFIRIAWVAVPLLTFVTVWQAIVAYLIIGIIGAAAKSRRGRVGRRSEFDRMDDASRRSFSVHDVRTKLDTADRRMMAIDDHLNNSDSEALAREIEALRKQEEDTK
jgi:phage shock protein PspC (stress-responsive transcriptional regulator)